MARNWVLAAFVAVGCIAQASADLRLEHVRQWPAQGGDWAGFHASYYALEDEAASQVDPVQRQADYDLLARLGKRAHSEKWEIRPLQRAIAIDDGNPQVRKACILRLADRYARAIGHDLPYLDMEAYLPAAFDLIDGMLADETLKPWRAEALQAKAKLLNQTGRHTEAKDCLRTVLREGLESGKLAPGSLAALQLDMQINGVKNQSLEQIEAALGSADLEKKMGGWLTLSRRYFKALKQTGRTDELAPKIEAFVTRFEAQPNVSLAHQMRFLSIPDQNGPYGATESQARREDLVRSNPGDPMHSEYAKNIRVGYLRSRNVEKAQEWLEYSMRDNPNDPYSTIGGRCAAVLILNMEGNGKEAEAVAAGLVDFVRQEPVNVELQLSALLGLRNGVPQAPALFEEVFSNVKAALPEIERVDQKLDLLRKLTIGAMIHQSEKAFDYVMKEIESTPQNVDTVRDLVDIRFVHASWLYQQSEKEKALAVLQSIQKTTTTGPVLANVALLADWVENGGGPLPVAPVTVARTASTTTRAVAKAEPETPPATGPAPTVAASAAVSASAVPPAGTVKWKWGPDSEDKPSELKIIYRPPNR